MATNLMVRYSTIQYIARQQQQKMKHWPPQYLRWGRSNKECVINGHPQYIEKETAVGRREEEEAKLPLGY